MRRFFFAFSLLVLLTPIAPRAEDAAQPLPLDKECHVPPDDLWSDQEKFVWGRVCIGDIADFNKTTGITLDPRQPEGWSGTRTLSSSFIETILLKDKYRKALTRNGLHIVGARFSETLDLENAALGHILWCDRCLFERGVNLRRLTSERLVMFSGSTVKGLLDLNTSHVGSSLFLRGGGEFQDIDLTAAYVGGTLDLTGSKVTRDLNMNSIHVTFHIMMNNVEIRDADVRRGTIGGNLQLTGSKVSGLLDMKGIRIGAVLFMQGANFTGVDRESSDGVDHKTSYGVDLEGAHVEGNVELDGSSAAGTINMTSIQIGGELHMSSRAMFKDLTLRASRLRVLQLNDSSIIGKLDMVGVYVETWLSIKRTQAINIAIGGGHVGGDADLSESSVLRDLKMNGLRIDGTLHAAKLYVGAGAATSARIGGQFDLTDAIVDGDLEGTDLETGRDLILTGGKFYGLVKLNRARVTGNLELNKGKFHKLVNLTGAHIGGAANFAEATWPDKGAVRLRDAHADIITGFANVWPEMEKSRNAECPTTQVRSADELTGTSRVDLDGFTYRSVNNPSEFAKWFARFDCYAAQSYSQLASVVQAQGNYELATQIRFAGRDRERGESSGLAYAWLTMLWATIGYGYYPQLALIWVFVFVGVGTIALGNSEQSWRNGLSSWSDRVVFSIDTLLPIIRLREQNYKIDLNGALAYYFYFHKIMGYALASFLIAGLSGLTK